MDKSRAHRGTNSRTSAEESGSPRGERLLDNDAGISLLKSDKASGQLVAENIINALDKNLAGGKDVLIRPKGLEPSRLKADSASDVGEASLQVSLTLLVTGLNAVLNDPLTDILDDVRVVLAGSGSNLNKLVAELRDELDGLGADLKVLSKLSVLLKLSSWNDTVLHVLLPDRVDRSILHQTVASSADTDIRDAESSAERASATWLTVVDRAEPFAGAYPASETSGAAAVTSETPRALLVQEPGADVLTLVAILTLTLTAAASRVDRRGETNETDDGEHHGRRR